VFSTKKIKIARDLYDQLTETAQKTGYASTDELIVHVLQREVTQLGDDLDQDQAEEQLRGLGYLE